LFQNILFRYGLKNNLSFVCSIKKDFFGYPNVFRASRVEFTGKPFTIIVYSQLFCIINNSPYYVHILQQFAVAFCITQLSIAVGYRMFLGMKDLDFARFESNLPKSNQFCPNLIKFSQI